MPAASRKAEPSPQRWRGWDAQRKRILLRHLWRERYWSDPVAFVHDYVEFPEGEQLVEYQEEALSQLHQSSLSRVAQYGPHGLGKTTSGALAIIHFSLTRDGDDWKAPTTASVWRQLEQYLWPEVHKWWSKVRWSKLGLDPQRDIELLDMEIKGQTGSAFAVASNDPAKIEGAHADHVLYVYDEAKAIPANTFDASEGAFSGAGEGSNREAHGLAFSTPAEPVGRFADICHRKDGYEDWTVIHVNLERAVAAGRVSAEWAERRRKQWGEGSALYANRVLGEFAASDTDSVIPLAWVDAAQERWRFRMRSMQAGNDELGALTAIGVDVADTGVDKTVLALRYGDFIDVLRRYDTGDTMMTTGRVNGAWSSGDRRSFVVVDSIGIGAGVVARLRELEREKPANQRRQVYGFNASSGSKRKDRTGEFGFVNLRSEAIWGLREMLDPAFGATLCLPVAESDELNALLVGDLTAPKWWVTSGGKIAVESKDDIRERIGRSTDDGDAVVMVAWQPYDTSPARSSSAAAARISAR